MNKYCLGWEMNKYSNVWEVIYIYIYIAMGEIWDKYIEVGEIDYIIYAWEMLNIERLERDG